MTWSVTDSDLTYSRHSCLSPLLILGQFCLPKMHPAEWLALLLLVYHPGGEKVLLQKKEHWLTPELMEWS